MPNTSSFAGAIFSNAPVGLIVFDQHGTVVDANPEALRQLELSLGQLLGCGVNQTLSNADGHPPLDEIADVLKLILESSQGTAGHVVELLVGGKVKALKIDSQPMIADNGEASWQLASLVDVTKEWAQCKSLVAAKDWVEKTQAELSAYKAALERHAIVGVTDRTGRITYANQKFCEISGYSAAELIGQKHSLLNSGHHPKAFFADMWRTISGGDPRHGEICNRAKDASEYWVDTTVAPLRNPAGQITNYLSIRYDITEKKIAEAALHAEVTRRREAEALLLDVIESIPDAVGAFDQNDRLLIFNSAYRDFYTDSAAVIQVGADFESILRHSVSSGQFVLPNDSPEGREMWIARRLREHRAPGNVSIQQLSNGRWLQVREQRSQSGCIVGVRTDITALKEAESLIKSQAERDPLTGLFNRSILLDRLTGPVERSVNSGAQGALVVADLDNFKDVNDTLGHDCGDELLVQIARRINETVRVSDTVVRLGGDEFAIILPNVKRVDQIDRLMQKLIKKIAAPIELAGRSIRPSATMGICTFPHDSVDPAELLKFSDIALYQAKAHNRGRYCFFSEKLREGLERREAVADALRLALENGEIDIALQPQFKIADGAHAGFEALARWRHREGEMPPGQFIPVAEETGLIIPLGQYVLERTLAEASRLKKLSLTPGIVAVNVAASQLKLDNFPETIETLLRRYGLPPEALEIEITENVLLDRSSRRIGQSLQAIHEIGIQIALDDFGTGHASLSHLKRIPVDRLKLDRSFVCGIGINAGDEVIVRTILNLAQSLGKSVVAEGVETRDQLNFLRNLGCDIGQGYLLSVPLAPQKAERFLRKNVSCSVTGLPAEPASPYSSVSPITCTI
ncbi:EAL domain-containing protein [Roseibium marinum]|uniref:PAS domain S-box-containing protein/diguanylate cyclase (GGDEF)-like protein n=1 Tax=Roseibium marinum TaxID=281252 RepID=A0A2S3UQ98_9HYPH|nr:EAL domain-containing protein [Roseibium marinum]POF29669.1 PAS domain S-box-containing protein/diguanylate cyclase (GGDEF)-like protein [Roseibium marinum]